jgi:protein required for attachment to host cells
MHNTWILVANSAKARILEDSGEQNPLKLVREIDNPDGRAHAADLVTSPAGRSQNSTGQHASLASHTDPHRNTQQRFAHELIELLDAGRRSNSFDGLIIASSSPFLGMLLDECGEQLRHDLRRSIARNLCDLPLDKVREAIGAGAAHMARPH